MLLTDRDKLMYNTEAENVYGDFYKYKELFDFSNDSADSRYCNNANT